LYEKLADFFVCLLACLVTALFNAVAAIVQVNAAHLRAISTSEEGKKYISGFMALYNC